jgi:hypothetical protein
MMDETVKEALKLLNRLFKESCGSQIYAREIKTLFKLIETQTYPRIIVQATESVNSDKVRANTGPKSKLAKKGL